MKIPFVIAAAFAFLLSLAFCADARADIFLGFSLDGSAPADSGPVTVNAMVGQTVSVNVFYVENGTDTLLNDRGLTGFEFASDYNPDFARITSAAVNPLFNLNASDVSPAGKLQQVGTWLDFLGTEGQQVLDGDGNVIFTRGRGQGQSSIRLATLDIEVLGSGVTHIDLIDMDQFQDQNPGLFPGDVSGEDPQFGYGGPPDELNPPEVDRIIFGPLAAPRLLRLTVNSVAVVPEPSSAAFLGLLCLGLATARRRRRI